MLDFEPSARIVGKSLTAGKPATRFLTFSFFTKGGAQASPIIGGGTKIDLPFAGNSVVDISFEVFHQRYQNTRA